MKFISILEFLSLVSGLVGAEKLNQCDELRSQVSRLIDCETNEEGEIQQLKISEVGEMMTEEEFMKVQSYDTVTDFSYEYTIYENPVYAKNLITDFNYLTNLKNFKNLEKLSINYDVSYNPCTSYCPVYYLGTLGKGTFKDLKNLKELKVNAIELSQDNIDEISTLSNLESLSLNYCHFNNVTDFSSLSNLKKVSYLSSVHGPNDYEVVPVEFVNQFKNVKQIYVDNTSNIDYKQYINLENLRFDHEEDTSFLKDYKNLKYLFCGPTNDLSVLEYVDSLEELVLKFDIPSHGYASFPYENSNFKFSENSNMMYLFIYGVRITNENMAEILKLKNLKYIHFEKCNFSLLNDEYFLELKAFQNRCPFTVEYYSCYFKDGFSLLDDVNNSDCDNFTSVIITNEPTTTLSEPVSVPEPTNYYTEINELEPTDYYTEIEDPEPTNYYTEINELESTDYYTEIEDSEPTNYYTEINELESTDYYTEIEDPEPTNYYTELYAPKPKYIEYMDNEKKSKDESSPTEKSRKRKCIVKYEY